jgi:hypothetical protein
VQGKITRRLASKLPRQRGVDLFKCPFEGFHKWRIPPNGWSKMENPIKIDDLGVPPF